MKSLGWTGLLIAAGLFSPPSFASDNVSGTIEKNVDGDTVWIDSDEWKKTTTMKIRMLGIDAPETHLPTSHGIMNQGHWGTKASQQMARLLPLHANVDVEEEGKDKYGRVLGRVFRHDKDANLEMLRTGWAIPYIICEGPRCHPGFFDRENVAGYLEACDSAREAGLGIFDPEDKLKEMPFEFRLRLQNRKPDKYVGDFSTKKLYRPTDYKKVDLCKRVFFMKVAEAERAGFERAF